MDPESVKNFYRSSDEWLREMLAKCEQSHLAAMSDPSHSPAFTQDIMRLYRVLIGSTVELASKTLPPGISQAHEMHLRLALEELSVALSNIDHLGACRLTVSYTSKPSQEDMAAVDQFLEDIHNDLKLGTPNDELVEKWTQLINTRLQIHGDNRAILTVRGPNNTNNSTVN
ncbi:hypothetical protein [Ferrimonas marina]|uniref:Uncharacterized protein n=1 Tax=Ferrimonas marina TaxID=299255 RepID=A0A1M5T713_9GAMM|nr:hypothetical protein [Ferrimonas marina]SHH46173.1 hypothetical protein SAMN02745129_2015 [Ferrimonas marina]